jgi:hypothetical protein
VAATPTETATLVKRLRGKGLSDAQVVDSLRGLGYPKAAATAAVGGGPAPAAPGGSGGETPSPAAPSTDTSDDEQADEPGGDGNGGGRSKRALPSFDLPSPTLTPPRRLGGGDVAGFLFGLFLFALGMNYLEYGPAGVKGWFRAKFLNDPMDPTTARLVKEGSVPQAPQVGGSAALEQLLTEPLTPSSSTGLTSTKAATPVNV